jgi:hypothetical protein
MVPLHLRSTTVHVSVAQAERLVAEGVAEWLPGHHGLVTKAPIDPVQLALA